MPFMNRDELISEAERLGVELEGLSWPEQNRAVQVAQRAELDSIDDANKETMEQIDKDQRIRELEAKLKEMEEAATRSVAEHHGDTMAPINMEREIPDYDIIITPEMAETAVQLFKYDEVLGEDVVVEEQSFDIRQLTDEGLKGYKIKGRSGTKVVGQSTLPKYNAGIVYNPKRDWVPRVKWKGTVGYLWSHHTLPNIKGLLQQTGFWYELKDDFDSRMHPNVIWYAGGIPVVDIQYAEGVMRKAEKMAREKAARGF